MKKIHYNNRHTLFKLKNGNNKSIELLKTKREKVMNYWVAPTISFATTILQNRMESASLSR